MPAVRKFQSPHSSPAGASQTAPTKALRKYQPSRVLAQMENATKKYPKFFHPHEVKAIEDSGGWEMVHEDDPDVFVIANDHKREEEKSEVRLAPTPISTTLLELDEGWSTPPSISFAPKEALLTPRSSARPTVPLGAEVVMVLPEEEPPAGPPIDLVAQSFAALLARPEAPRVYTPAPPQPLLPSVVAPPKRSWAVPVVVASAVLSAGLAIFGGTHLAKRAHIEIKNPIQQTHFEQAVRAPQREAEHSERSPSAEPLEVSPARLEMGLSAPAPAATTDEPAKAGEKKPTMTGPTRARMALAAGDLETASALFEELAESPSTKTDGLWGLAEVSRARGDLLGAQARFREILATSPQYFPAKLGLADTTWELGDREAARKMYLGLEGYPTPMIPARVAERTQR